MILIMTNNCLEAIHPQIFHTRATIRHTLPEINIIAYLYKVNRYLQTEQKILRQESCQGVSH